MRARVFFVIFFLKLPFLYCQELQIIDTLLNTGSKYKDINSVSWSVDASEIVFYATDSMGPGIFVYNLSTGEFHKIYRDSLLIGDVVWHPNHRSVVYDKKSALRSFLFLRDVETDMELPLFKREISARQPSFSNNDNLVTFSGFDIIADNWQIYSYDFVYNNLNQLTKGGFDCVNPVFSPDGKHILYEKIFPEGDTSIEMINWYGNYEMRVDGYNVHSPIWKSDSWRFIFVKEAAADTEVYSSRINGHGLIQLTNNDVEEVEMVYSPDNQLVAMIIKENGNKVLFILSVE
jgi:Tol biopolymer transport system component